MLDDEEKHQVSAMKIRNRRIKPLFDIEEKYQVSVDERYMKLRDSVQEKANKIRQLKEDAAARDQEAQLLIEESMQKRTEYEIGEEGSYEAVQEAFDTAREAGEAAKEAKNNVEQAIKEYRVRQDMLAKKEETVRMRIAAEIRQEHRAVIKKLQDALKKAVKINTEALRLEQAFRRNKQTRNVKLERELGGLPGLGIRALMNIGLNPDGTRNREIGADMSEYKRWLWKVQNYGYLED